MIPRVQKCRETEKKIFRKRRGNDQVLVAVTESIVTERLKEAETKEWGIPVFLSFVLVREDSGVGTERDPLGQTPPANTIQLATRTLAQGKAASGTLLQSFLQIVYSYYHKNNRRFYI